jgi:hypothetical protein
MMHLMSRDEGRRVFSSLRKWGIAISRDIEISGRTLFRLLGKDLGRHLRLILTNKA